MNRNLPQVMQEGFFTKIKNWLKKIFGKHGSIEYPIPETMYNEIDEIKKENFVRNIKIESMDKILMLQKKLKEKQIEISDLTDQELDEMIELYKSQITDKKIKLKQYQYAIKNVLQ